LRFIDVDVLLIFTNIESEFGLSKVFDCDFFSSTNGECDWDNDLVLKISAFSIIADYNRSAEIKSNRGVNNKVLGIIEV